mgnify:CR=1 FL=1
MVDLFIRVQHDDDQVLIAKSAVVHGRFRKATDTRPATVMLILTTKGLTPDPRNPVNIVMQNTRYEFTDEAAHTAWAQLWQRDG